MRQVVLIPGEPDEGGYTAIVPSLPGCISEGDTVDEALANIKEAMELFIETLEAHGQEVPTESGELMVFSV